jgi:hypothetical protein
MLRLKRVGMFLYGASAHLLPFPTAISAVSADRLRTLDLNGMQISLKE